MNHVEKDLLIAELQGIRASQGRQIWVAEMAVSLSDAVIKKQYNQLKCAAAIIAILTVAFIVALG